MNKKVVIFLTVVVVALTIANIVVLTLGAQKLMEKQFEEKQPAAPASETHVVQVKQASLPPGSFIALTSGSGGQSQEESIGTQAGKTAAELQKTSQEVAKILNEQTAKTAQEVQIAWNDIMQKFNLELEKFNEELKKQQNA